MADPSSSRIRVGIGGWNFEPWRDNFYPPGWPQEHELGYASTALTAIEINSTYHGTQKRESFAKWRDNTPDGFVFSVKASRFATNQRVLANAGESVRKFIGSGIGELGPKLGPVVWQFATTKRFEPDDFKAFLDLLPAEVEGVRLRHAMDVRHASFMTPEYLALARRHGVATVFSDSDDYPSFADLTGDFVYARLMRTQPEVETGYAAKELASWAGRARTWAAGGEPGDLPRVAGEVPKAAARDVFAFFISGAKERAPAAARGLIELLE
jgi:uncharacterized protein YecE (DUF72 family)